MANFSLSSRFRVTKIELEDGTRNKKLLFIMVSHSILGFMFGGWSYKRPVPYAVGSHG